MSNSRGLAAVAVAGLMILNAATLPADDLPPAPNNEAAENTPPDSLPLAAESTPIAPVPVTGNGWQGGWSGAYAPSGSYWYHVPQNSYTAPYVAGYTPGMAPTSWNGYWNYGTAYGAPGFTAYWHGWYTGPYYYEGPYHHGWHGRPYRDYSWQTWSHHGWGYSSIGWGHGYWHRPLVHSPRYHRHAFGW